ncbi:MAG: hypothetical protein FD123_3888 [Bacteroidetes bacterium]|nr:MAG: hypothetical protein FD123_3888 [Bacteroidota bacterium]
MKIKRQLLAIPVATAILFSIHADARENGARGQAQTPNSQRNVDPSNQLLASCTPATSKTDLDFNNVRTTILAGGDMWWDLVSAKYEVPKDGGAHSVFAGSLWIGGLDAGGQLKVAGMTYRQTGNDFWPGPLDTVNVSVDQDVCDAYDKHWKITRKEVEDYAEYLAGNATPGYVIPQSITTWPGNGDASRNQGRYLAPFHDADGDGIYNYSAGDYPGYELGGNVDCKKDQLFGDQTLWWVFNDKGNVHTETGAQAIGLELQAQAFAFATNDEINNMTFYKYKVINRSTISLNSCYFGVWVDSDLGAYDDDYVGCDVGRGLGYTYNGDANDGSSASAQPGTYGANPPALGVDFFQGPLADAGDGIDNDRDGALDETGEQIIMSKFLYYNNDFSITGNPENATHFYNYLIGLWKDGTPFTYDQTGYGGTQPCDFMFPGSSDPLGWGTNFQPQSPWDEVTEGNVPADRRFLQSAGAFTLQPGAVNYVTAGVVWARATSGGPTASVNLMRVTDDKAQALFNNCFQVLNGPDAPDMTLQELDKEIILYLSNKPNSNNYLERYNEIDPLISPLSNDSTLVAQNIRLDSTYNFEGYQIFQLKDATVTTTDLYDADKARLVAQCDVRNGYTQLINFEFDQALQANVPKDMTLEANDVGIAHSFKITDDAFASGNTRLVNHKTYYFLALSYGFNQYIPYADDIPPTPGNPLAASVNGQKKPYKAGRKNIKVYSAIPHIPSPEAGGTNQQGTYGTGPKLTRIEGNGNGGNVLDLDDASTNAILSALSVDLGGNARADQISYLNGRGPVNIKVVDPLNVPEGNFELKFLNTDPIGNNLDLVTADSATWVLTQTSPVSRSWNSDTVLLMHNANEQIIPELGLSISITQQNTIGNDNIPTRNGFLEATMTFTDPTKNWLSGIEDADGQSNDNWIRAGSTAAGTAGCDVAAGDVAALDVNGEYEKVLGGTWAPFRLASIDDAQNCFIGPGHPGYIPTLNKIEAMASVDIVFTPDKNKWSRCIVLETGPNAGLNEGAVKKWRMRAGQSVDKNGNPDGTGTGMGWFPGYAINVETGERLNIAFGENSALVAENGRDMKWNPTTSRTSQLFEDLWGGMHFIYVWGHNGNQRYGATPAALAGQRKDMPAYDQCAAIKTIMTSTSAYTGTGVVSEMREVLNDVMWVNIPMITEDRFEFTDPGNMPCEAKIRLRVAKQYNKYYSPIVNANINYNANALNLPDSSIANANGNNPYYTFNTSDLMVTTNDNASAVNALDLINVVPNPYYAFSGYETSQLDNRIKFTNLPEKCTVRVYTVNGTQIRKITKDSPQTYVDWDLKNQAGIPVASGMYIIHVDVPGVGEKILKWFGVMRPIDLDSF